MKKTFYLAFILLNCFTTLSGQTDTTEVTKSQLELSGSVDVYFRQNLNSESDLAPATSFANLPGFALGMANLIVAQEGKNFGFTADLVVGPRGEDATFLSPTLRPDGSSNIVNQLFVYWKATDALTVTLGNFNTFLGYEVISPKDNFNYSTSYMFSYGPFSHTGLKVDLALENGISLMGGVFNPTDATEFNPSNEYAFGSQIGYENEQGLSIYLNGLFAKDYNQVDLTAGYDVSEKVYFGLNGTIASDNFMGIAAYFQVATSDKLKLGLRAESFTDKGVEIFQYEENVFATTVSANYTIGHFTFIPEIRLDYFSQELIFGSEGTNYLSSFVLAAVYGF